MKKRSVIPPELRPYVAGSTIQARKDSRRPQDKANEPLDIIIIAPPNDSTAQYFMSYCQQKSIKFSFVSLNCVDSLLDFLQCQSLFAARKYYPGIYFRDGATTEYHLATILSYLADILFFYPGKIVNKPAKHSLNTSKPLQMAALGKLNHPVISGIRTYVSNVPKKQLITSEKTIVKSISSIRSKVVNTTHDMILSKKLPVPIQIQPQLNGQNIRAHVCDDTVFAIAIQAEGVDYRYAENMSAKWIDLPKEIHEWCIQACKYEQLQFAGVDLFLSQTGTWYCFEINPSPGYHVFEAMAAVENGYCGISEYLCTSLTA